MLETNSAIISDIIIKARQFHVKEEAPNPDDTSEPSDDMCRQVLTDTKDDSVYEQLLAEINDLEPIQQVELVALTWMGRGDYDVSEWDSAINQAKRSWNRRTAEYLLGDPLVADYLEEGLTLLGFGLEMS
jgi:hypothetical protein